MPQIRPATASDVEATFDVRGATRQNAIPRERLARLGITPASVVTAMAGGDYGSWVCESDGSIVGFCNADANTAEVIVLAVRAGYECRGIGRELLGAAVAYLLARGQRRPWLLTPTNATLRSHGFYRANGWSPSGRLHANGDEELVYLGVETQLEPEE